jgi:uncharacterized protein YgbK (DUF1537 family)
MDMSPKPQIAIIADDLTGAADTGAYFGQVGLVTMVVLALDGCVSAGSVEPSKDSILSLSKDAAPLPCNVLVVSTESRHLARDEAVVQVQRAARRIADECQASWVYKKIDSTLRGHPGPELAAIMDAMGLEQALVAPAFPAQGRTTRKGRQWVAGGAHGADLLALFRATAGGRPVRGLELDLVRRGPAAVSEALQASARSIVIADAETDADLASLAGAAVTCRLRLLCGSAGLARALADALLLPPVAIPVAPLPQFPGPGASRVAGLPLRRRPRGPVLIVAGSRHPCTARQVESSRRGGTQVVRPSPAFLGGDERAVAVAVRAVTYRLERGQDVILTTATIPAPSDGAPVEAMVAAQLGRVVRALALGGQVGGLVLTGGDTAAAVCSALAATALWLRGEVQPGIAWGRLLDGALPGLPVVTKAGGFGADDALAVALRHLHLLEKTDL